MTDLSVETLTEAVLDEYRDSGSMPRDIPLQVILERLESIKASKARGTKAMCVELALLSDIEDEIKRLKTGLTERMRSHIGTYGRVTVSKPAKTRSVDCEGLWKFLARNNPDMLPIVFDKASTTGLDAIKGAIPGVLKFVTEADGVSRVTVKKRVKSCGSGGR